MLLAFMLPAPTQLGDFRAGSCPAPFPNWHPVVYWHPGVACSLLNWTDFLLTAYPSKSQVERTIAESTFSHTHTQLKGKEIEKRTRRRVHRCIVYLCRWIRRARKTNPTKGRQRALAGGFWALTLVHLHVLITGWIGLLSLETEGFQPLSELGKETLCLGFSFPR